MAKLPFLERIAQGPILADGAMGTMLHSKNAPLDEAFDALNVTNPAMVADIHRAYLDAGAEIIETNTFGANRFKLREHGFESRVAEVNQAGVELARRVVDASFKDDVYVAGSVGPLGVRLAPFGRVGLQEAYEAFAEQIKALAEAGADLIVLETFSDLYEIREAVRAARDVCDLPLVAEITFTRDDRTLLGDSATKVGKALSELDVDVIGANCSSGPAQILRVFNQIKQNAPGKHLSAIPNAGWPEQVGGRVMYPAGPDYFGDYATAFREAGATIVGGCCGTTPAHIAAMREALDNPARPVLRIDLPHPTSNGESIPDANEPTELARKLADGEFVISVEMAPPRGIAPNKVIAAAQMLKEAGATVVNVSDSPMARLRMSPWAVCHLIQRDVGIETVLHFPTRGRNLLRVQGDLLAAHALDVRNLFVMMGDPTHIGDYPDADNNYDVVPSGLVRLVKQSLNVGRDQAGNEIGQPTAFLVGCALHMGAQDIEREIKVLRRKIEAGADFAITQPIFDPQVVSHFLNVYEDAHGKLKIPVFAGLLPLHSDRNARFLHNEVPGIDIPAAVFERIEKAGGDSPQEGVRVAQELAFELRDRVQGLYLMPAFSRYDLAAEVIEAVRAEATLA